MRDLKFSPEFLKISEIAQHLGTTRYQVERWMSEGRMPAAVEIDGHDLHNTKVIPADEVRYIIALMRAGNSWHHIENEVRRVHRLRQRLAQARLPGHLNSDDDVVGS